MADHSSATRQAEKFAGLSGTGRQQSVSGILANCRAQQQTFPRLKVLKVMTEYQYTDKLAQDEAELNFER